MGGIASCLPLAQADAPPSPMSKATSKTVVHYSAAPDTALRLAFAYASRPGTLHAPASSSSLTKAFAARCQPLKPNQDSILISNGKGSCPFLHIFGVFDGHGEDGGAASRFARDRMEALLLGELRSRSGGKNLDQVASLSNEAVTAALKAAFQGTERALGRTLEVDDSFSGTTAVVVVLIGCRLFAASVGDSRAILGVRKGEAAAVEVDALTWDHNPYRPDEYARIKDSGGVVMTYGQMAAGGEPSSGHPPTMEPESMPSLDPPRVWDRALKKPGCCFTRSLGDSFAKTLGVIAEPEVACRQLGPGAYCLCLTSDGVTECLSNEALLALVAAHRDRPLHACRTVCVRSSLLSPPAGTHETPAQRERREVLYHHRDDTTLINIQLDVQRTSEPPRP